MIIERFIHEIDDGGYSETATLVFEVPTTGRGGIQAERLPATVVVAMRAYLTGTVTEPVEWQIQDVSIWDVGFTGGINSMEINLRRMSPSVVGPHDGNGWWAFYWPKVQKAQAAIEFLKGIGL